LTEPPASSGGAIDRPRAATSEQADARLSTGVYVYRDNRPPRFQRVKAPNKDELEDLVQLISQRVGRCLERQGLLEQDTESAWLELEPADDTDAMPHLLGSSVSYRIAVGPQQGRKAFMIRTIRPLDRPDPGLERVAKANGFSLHARVNCEGHQKDKRERLCRYIARPAVAVPRLSLSSTGKVLYTLKTPYRDGTTHCAESGYGIRINSVHPGFIETPMVANGVAAMGEENAQAFQERILNSIPMGAMGQPKDIANGVLFLASDESAYMTGSELVIDGGFTAH
jgi:hypothetical protein